LIAILKYFEKQRIWN